VASNTPGERLAGSSNGAKRPRKDSVSEPATLGTDEQTLADAVQTLADTDQTSSDFDQSASDQEQSASDQDQLASDSDQQASDFLLSCGGDQVDYDASRDVRDRGTTLRQHSAQDRVDAAASRDVIARERDLAAAERDRAAAQMDHELQLRQDLGPQAPKLKAMLLRAVESRLAAAADRAVAASARTRAAADRDQAARDRDQAARDRVQSELDRAELATQLAIAETDQLTGSRSRTAGLAELDHEMARARRTNGHLVVGYVDIVGLKAVNDAAGHSAGDQLLRHAVKTIRAHMRSYDLIVRLGGDEFLCVLSDATTEILAQRFEAIKNALLHDPRPCEIRVGIAALTDSESAPDLIKRADALLPASGAR
jgi:diguanylate cyclase (GGDEF)-like protein